MEISISLPARLIVWLSMDVDLPDMLERLCKRCGNTNAATVICRGTTKQPLNPVGWDIEFVTDPDELVVAKDCSYVVATNSLTTELTRWVQENLGDRCYVCNPLTNSAGTFYLYADEDVIARQPSFLHLLKEAEEALA